MLEFSDFLLGRGENVELLEKGTFPQPIYNELVEQTLTKGNKG